MEQGRGVNLDTFPTSVNIKNIENHDYKIVPEPLPEKDRLPFIGKDGKPYPTMEDVEAADALFDEMRNPKIDIDTKMYHDFDDDTQKRGR